MLLKKIFVVSTVILIFASIFAGVYFLVFKKSSDDIEESNLVAEKKDFNSLKTVSSKVSNITSEPVISAALNKDDGLIYYYNGLDGTLWSMTERATNASKINLKKVSNVKSINWSEDTRLAIITFNNGKILFSDHQEKRHVDFTRNADSITWSNINDKVIYKQFNLDTKERSLNVSNVDGSDSKKIANLNFRHVSFQSIPHSIQVAFWPKADAFVETKLSKTNITSLSDSQEVFGGKFGADFLFSPDGSKFIISYTTEEGGQKVTLGTANSQGKEYKELGIPTLVQKVVWSKDNNTIYYAQPSGVFTGNVMPNDYLDNKIVTQDTFWKIDLNTGKKERLVKLEELTEQIDATNLFLSKTEDALFFINRANGLLYKLNMN